MKKTEQEKEDDLLEEIRGCYKDAKKHSADWRTEAVENYDFVASRQWSEEDTATLEEQGRPVVTFNRMGPYFDAICGSQINNRQEIKYLPRTQADTHTNETLNAAVKWVTGETDAEDEESDAFHDVLVCGMGWIETRMDYDDTPDGKVVMERVDPLEMYWDPTAKKKNLRDSKWFMRVKWLEKEELEERWPDLEISPASSPWGDDAEIKSAPHNASLAFLYRENSTDGYDEKTGKYRVVRYMYYTKADVYRVADPVSRKVVSLTPEKFELAQKMAEQAGMPLRYATQKTKVYKYCFVVGDQIAEQGDLKCGFNVKCITGKRDQNTNLWFGLARVMKDPQRWANKFLAQIMHIVNSNAKGGLLAEEGAFKDIKKAEEAWTDPTAIITLKNGGLQKVKDRTQAQYPVGLDKLLQFAVSSIPDVTGVNPEFVAAADREQAGVLEVERKKSVYTILAGFFASLRLYRKEQGRLLAHFVKEYLNDGRIIRITTDQGEAAIPLHLTNDVIEYDVIVDQAPSSPNLKEEVWATLGQLIPAMLKAGVPPPPEILMFSPLPESIARAYMERMKGQLPPQVMQQMQWMQQQLQQLTLENAQLKQNADVKMAQIQSKHELGKEKNAVANMDSLRNAQVELERIRKENESRFAELQIGLKQHITDSMMEAMKMAQADRHKAAEIRQKDRHKAADVASQRSAN